MTITLDEVVHDGLVRVIGRGKISQFLEDLARPHVTDQNDLASAYKAMANDKIREGEALDWCNSLIQHLPIPAYENVFQKRTGCAESLRKPQVASLDWDETRSLTERFDFGH